MYGRLINLSVVVMALAFGLALSWPATAQDDMEPGLDDAPPPPHEQGDENAHERPPRRPGGEGEPMGEHGKRRRFERGGFDRSGRGGGRGMPELSSEDLERAMAILRDYNPEMAERIEKLRERHPDEAKRMLRRAAPMVRKLLHMQETDPEAYQLHLQDTKLGVEAHELARRIQSEDEVDDDAINALRKVVAEHFEVRQKLRENELVKLEKKLETLRQQIEKRQSSRDQLIESRVSELTGKKRDAQW